jgi:hypothetical protein
MNGFEWKNQRGVEGVGFVRALRTLLTQRLSALLPKLQISIEKQFAVELQKCKRDDGKAALLNIGHKNNSSDRQ